MIPELDRWKRFPNPWRELGPRMAAVMRAVGAGESPPLVPAAFSGPAGGPPRLPGQYKRLPGAARFSGRALRRYRVDAGYSQSGLGYLVGTTQGIISAWELGKTVPPIDRMAALAKALGCLPSDLCP